jgi:hypothetical protein
MSKSSFAALALVVLPLLSWADGPATIPLKRVVMFSSGVAFYERNGEVEGNATLDLKFNTRDVNDLLKSMVLQDLGGGKISTVSYASKEPVGRALSSFTIDLNSNPTLADLLGQIRGEKIEIDAPNKLAGVIVGIEKRKQAHGEQAIEVNFLNLLTDDGLRSVSLENVGKIKLSNPKLDAELRKALMILALGKDVDKKSVSLSFLGDGKRGVRVGYIQESPIWKTSYRLVLGDDEKPLLQGWAIVENTTEEDWNGVDLTLISGRPISFVMDLYQPLYVGRPLVQPELYASLRPRTYDQDLASANKEFLQRAEAEEGAGEGRARFASGGPASGGFGGGRPTDALAKKSGAAAGDGRANRGLVREQLEKAAEISGKDLQNSLVSAAQATDVGEMFQYRIAEAVSVARQKSAMLPIVNESVAGEKLSIYNEGVHAKHPLNGFRLKNTTDLHLMQGPITVFDDGAYAGDAQIQALPPKSERLISYAMDLDVEVAPAPQNANEEMTQVKFVKGVLQVSRKYARSREYTVKNSNRKARKVLVEYPLDTNWTLTEPAKFEEKTRDQYRFAVAAEPGKPAKLTVREERKGDEHVHVNNLDDNGIRFYINAKVVSDKVKAALEEVIKRKAAIGAIAARRAELDRQIKVIFDEQNRIRQNMEKLPNDSEVKRRYITKLNDQETSVEGLREQVDKSIAEEQKLRQAFDAYLLGLDLS